MDCIRQVLTRWLDGPKDVLPTYPISWEGLYELLKDAELTDIIASLKEAIENAQCEFMCLEVFLLLGFQ